MSAERLCAQVSRVRRERSVGLAPLLLVLAIVIVAALASNLRNLVPQSGGAVVPEPDEGEAPAESATWDPFAIWLLVALPAALFLGLLFWLIVRHRPTAVRFPRSEFLGLAMVLLLLTALVLVGTEAVEEPFGESATNETEADGGTTDGSARPDGLVPRSVRGPFEVFLLISILASVMSLAFVIRRGHRRSMIDWDEGPRNPEAREIAAAVVEETVQALRLGEGVREAILGCFQRFCDLLGGRGVANQAPLTARELEDLAVDRLHVSREASEALTSLFEEARYSLHNLDEGDRHRAIESLERIQTSLEA